MRRRSDTSNRPIADAMTTAARAVFGRSWSRSGASSSNNAIASAPTTPVSCVLAPAASATGVREELLLIGSPGKSLPRGWRRRGPPSPVRVDRCAQARRIGSREHTRVGE